MDEWLNEKAQQPVRSIRNDGEGTRARILLADHRGAVAHLIGAADSEAEALYEWRKNWFELTGSTLLSPKRAEAAGWPYRL